MSSHFYVFFTGSAKRWETTNKHLILHVVCMYECMCMCVYVCVYTPPPWKLLPIARSLWHTWWVRISNVMLWVLFQVLLPSYFISISKYVIFHLRRWSSSSPKLTRKRYDIRFREKMIYIDKGYKSAHHQTHKWQNDTTKDKEATLIYILPLWIKYLALA